MSRVLPLLALLICATGCEGVDSGTAVGNPGRVGFATDDPTDGTVLARVDAHVVEVRAASCDGVLTERVIADDIFDLLQPMEKQVILPGGEYCTLDIELDTETPIFVEGVTAAGNAFDVVIAPGILRFDAAFLIDDNDYIVEFGIARTLPDDAIDALGPDSSTGKNEPLASEWADAIGLDSALEDDDGGVVARSSDNDTANPGDMASQGGCGCVSGSTASPANAAWAAAAIGLIALRRRIRS